MSSKKYEKKFNKHGIIETVEVKEEISQAPKPNMPTEVTDPGFIPEGRILVCTLIPYDDGTVVDASGIAPGHKDEYVIEKTSASGIVMAASKRKDKAPMAIVNAVGPDVRGYEPGDLVMYKPNLSACFVADINGTVYLLMEQYNLLGKYIS